MYISIVLLLMVVCPVLWICADRFVYHSAAPTMVLVGKWFVFWAGGIRLCSGGLTQLFRPRFTSERIFDITGSEALPFIRELGIANIATGSVCVLSLYKPAFEFPMAIVAAIFYSLAAIRHLTDSNRTRHQNAAMITDALVSLVLIAYVAHTIFEPGFR